jgi:tRNA (guanosine-2'-O-)-methyltransferase
MANMDGRNDQGNEVDREKGAGRPITERRLARMRTVLARRQPDLTVVIENVHDPHNVSAVLRSCEAVGVPVVHLVYTREERPELSRISSASASKWLEIVDHPDVAGCYGWLRERGFRIYATHLDASSHELYDLDLARPSALVFGNEQRGVSDEALRLADGSLIIPMMGMVQSLNISVACAVTLYEALRQRRSAGAYDQSKLGAAEIDARLGSWLRREGRTTP